MKLLLSGGGDPERVVHMDEFFVSKIDVRKTVLYIPVAWVNDLTYIECFDWFKRTYKPYSIDNIEMCTDLNNKSNINQYSAIFIGGGNTFKLLKLDSSKFSNLS